MNQNSEPDVAEKKEAEPLPVEPDEEVLDWDAYVPPPKRKGTIRVRLRYMGRSKPMPVPDPEDAS